MTLDKLKNHLIKQKELVMIENSIRCFECNKNVTGKDNQKIKAGKLYLSNSFYYVLQSLVDGYNSEDRDSGARSSGNGDK